MFNAKYYYFFGCFENAFRSFICLAANKTFNTQCFVRQAKLLFIRMQIVMKTSILIEDFCCADIIQFKHKQKIEKMSFYFNSFAGAPFCQGYESYPSLYSNMPAFYNFFPEYSLQSTLCFQNSQLQFFRESQKTLNQTQNTTIEVNLPEERAQVSQEEKNEKKKKIKSIQKEVSSAKKNSQSNIINQFYSHFSGREKTQRVVLAAIKKSCQNVEECDKILSLFYNTVRVINAMRGRKYVNRSMMLNYFTSEMLTDSIPQIRQKIQKLNYITLDQLCQVFRICCLAFLNHIVLPAILTSKRITGVSKQEHFKKRRRIVKAIKGN